MLCSVLCQSMPWRCNRYAECCDAALLPAAWLQPAQLLCGIAERGAHVHFMFVYRDPLRSVRPTVHACCAAATNVMQCSCVVGTASFKRPAGGLLDLPLSPSLCSDGGYDDNVSLSYKLPVREDAGALYGDGL